MESTSTDRFLVSPRHLAGAGDRLTDVLGPLIHLFEWDHVHDPASGRLSVDSPGHDLLLDFAPTDAHGTWWTIAHHDPLWKITATHRTPLEPLSAITQALPQLLGDTRHADRIPLTARSVAEISDLNGWTTDGSSFTSPDGHCTMHHEPGGPWRVEHSVYDGFGTHWSLRAEGDLPEELAAQFLTFLATPDPVERAHGDIPFLALSEARLTPLNGKQPLGAHVAHALGGLGDAASRGRSR
ncbi:DUF317 domain-containing protein [Streptomyces sp. NBC_00853]|uniref:DUF317 domain-containing protein n=1 Tax=Streptomyces sp. NBC_00853 TaxID=2903681 RepID=UPI003873BC88|nr:DUF317 domain-containing protein [Streptomyces sp. NBC_00853]